MRQCCGSVRVLAGCAFENVRIQIMTNVIFGQVSSENFLCSKKYIHGLKSFYNTKNVDFGPFIKAGIRIQIWSQTSDVNVPFFCARKLLLSIMKK
jgi:hypothetical protein